LPAEPIAFTWTDQPVAGSVQAMVADGDRFVVVGRDADGPLSWVSTGDGAWETVSVPVPTDVVDESWGLPPETAAQGSGMGPLARLGETLYSFGSFNFMDSVRPVGWRWTDGGAWEYIESASPFYETGRVTDVVAGNGALVAARQEVALSIQGARSTVWTWTADASWTQSDISVADGSPMVTDVAWIEGQYLASGFVVNPSEDAPVGRPIVWTSGDGLTWVEFEAPPTDGRVCALEADPQGTFVALSVDAEGSTVWTWSEGVEWNGDALTGAASHPSLLTDLFPGTCELVPLEGGLIAVLAGSDMDQTWTRAEDGAWVKGDDLPTTAGPTLGGNPLTGAGDRLVFASLASDPAGGPITSTLHTGTVAP
jgi:hypothetical protein